MMKSKNWRGLIVCMGIFSILLAGLSACRDKISPVPAVNEKLRIETKITSTPLPDGVRLKNLFMTHQGMRGGSYYFLRTTDSGTYMKISNQSPAHLNVSFVDSGLPIESAKYLAFADTVQVDERASLARLETDAPRQALEKALAQNGALDWDGFDKHVSMPNVEDSGDLYQLYLELTDGTTVTVDSYNASPAGFSPLLKEVQEIFHANRDYSHYQIQSFDESPCTSLYVSFIKAFGKGKWELELRRSDNQWTVVLQDPDGFYLPPGTDIADYGPTEAPLPFDRFLEIFKDHNAERWNGYDETDGDSTDHFQISLYFENGKEFRMTGSLLPEGFAEFQKAFIQAIQSFYDLYKS